MNITFEQVRAPLAIVLLVAALFVFWPRNDGSEPAAAAGPTHSIVVGEPGGVVLAAPTPNPTPDPTPDPTPEATPTPSPAETPPPPDTFSADVLACRDLAGSRCRGEFDEFPRRARAFTALVRFEDARAGDTISVTLSGNGVVINGGPFTLAGGGDGYYYSRITHGDLPDGEYQLVALRNGTEVARTTLRSD